MHKTNQLSKSTVASALSFLIFIISFSLMSHSALASSSAGWPQSTGTTFRAVWDGAPANSENWSQIAEEAVTRYGSALMTQAQDVAHFCPRYHQLGRADQTHFWVQLLASMSEFESGFNPASLFVETELGTDPVTGAPVVSAGLFQLSYQDTVNYRRDLPEGVCAFNFKADSRYSQHDLRRSILDPWQNITCAVFILNHQVGRYQQIAIGSGAYWAVIKTNSGHNRLSAIQKQTRSLPFCH
jgi:hypothetical protein